VSSCCQGLHGGLERQLMTDGRCGEDSQNASSLGAVHCIQQQQVHQDLYRVLLTDEMLSMQQLLQSTSGRNYRQVSVIAERSLNCNKQIGLSRSVVRNFGTNFVVTIMNANVFSGFYNLRKQN